MSFAFPLHAIFWHLRQVRSYRSETPTRKPYVALNIEGLCHVFAGPAACLLGHFQNFMRPGVFASLVWRRKFGKKLTNNFIILCELLCGAAQDLRHTKLSPPALAAQPGF
ncbi:hypothetical protein GGE16_002124 [Rhizobium leguminosarum]|uniref:Uncharacterized protein n=1 Tax=Rhizobium leguminosarum TaxID=384 RepID=A0AAE2SX32_RHILE|nr:MULTISPECIES: hypothetical protein [Rhizobium]MBB4290084.1 hypothetical protein [Rhizobium leguminosarum]MBB4296728.1 hypothetical protein [Rhizobium leguminosarum]MBB4308012.1 hypothetical protein [Rhizobium leguminosarum]MBB4415847.1 hypothetical protein [Rhizobium leguminosarum]MBB4431187.1 hypothetical protein [Rhizobium esperanzae]